MLALTLASPTLAATDSGEYLDVWSKGYSRFEIDNGDVVVFFTNGVEFDYLSFHATAAELRYNHATKAAEAVGGVTISLGDSYAACNELLLNGEAGELELSGAITGVLSIQQATGPEGGLGGALGAHANTALDESAAQGTARSLRQIHFDCDRALIGFPAGLASAATSKISLAELDVLLSGHVTLLDDGARALRCDEMRFTHEDSCLAIPGRFEFDGGPHPLVALDRDAGVTADLTATGKQFTATVGQDSAIQVIRARDVELVSDVLHVTAGEIRASDLSDSDAGERWQAYSAYAAPIAIELNQPGRAPLLASARLLRFQGTASGTGVLSFLGGVHLEAAGALVEGEELELAFLEHGGVEIAQPFAAGFDLAAMTGQETGLLQLNGDLAP